MSEELFIIIAFIAITVIVVSCGVTIIACIDIGRTTKRIKEYTAEIERGLRGDK